MVKNLLIVSMIGALIFGCKKETEVIPIQTEDKKVTQVCGQTISGQYIVLYKEDSIKGFRLAGAKGFDEREKLMEIRSRYTLERHGGNHKFLRHVYHSGIAGFSARMDKTVADEVRKDPSVELVEQDRILSLAIPFVNQQTASTQIIPWGVQRVGYGSGVGKSVWIIDTGVDLSHPDLNVDISNSRSFLECTASVQDDNGHGTHVAGIIGAKDNGIGIVGVAAGANLKALKALDKDGSGSVSDIILALQWVLGHGKSGDVINMSLGGTQVSPSLDKLVYQISMNGIYLAIAAGNESSNADTISPARVNSPYVFTVSAMNSNNVWASFSNFGSSVDVCSPGVDIFSTYLNGKYATMSGTSMAAPHIAGLLLLNGKNLNYSGYVIGDPDGKPDPIAHK
jgi:subtilisin family serine protease